jgi:D-tyrosyl-tRNA(Tyr) deacylase
MRVVVQRVSKAKVFVEGNIVGSISKGLVILVAVKNEDTEEEVKWLADKCVNLRIFENEQGKFHYSLLDIRGEILVISQFTLYGDCRRGRRPSFTDAAQPELAEELYEKFVEVLKPTGLKVQTGIFAARMLVEIHNNGPVTLILDSKER